MEHLIASMKELSKIIGKLKAAGKTIVIAEHRLWYLKDIVDRAIYLVNGRIVKEYSMKEIGDLNEEERVQTGLRHTELNDMVWNGVDAKFKKGEHLEVKRITFKRKRRTILAIDNIKFPFGNIIGIIGKNGVGKSTFAKILCGLEKQSSGKILENNKLLPSKKRLMNSLLIMQEVNYQIFTDNVRDEILLLSNIRDKKIIKDKLKDMELEDLIDRNPHMLSGGQKQRVIILSALLSEKNILFFDEPTSGLDYRNMKIVAENIKKIREKSKLILIISHDIEFLDMVCDHLIKICN